MGFRERPAFLTAPTPSQGGAAVQAPRSSSHHALSPSEVDMGGYRRDMTLNTAQQDLMPMHAVSGLPLRILRSEGVVLFVAALAGFFVGLDEPWWLVPLLLFVPDAFMVGYARSHRAGAMLYNFAHFRDTHLGRIGH